MSFMRATQHIVDFHAAREPRRCGIAERPFRPVTESTALGVRISVINGLDE